MTRQLSLIIFGLVPLPFCLLAWWQPNFLGELSQTLIWSIMVMQIIDLGHVFMTYPVYEQRRHQLAFGSLSFVTLFFISALFCVTFSMISLQTFLFFGAYGTLFHICRQQVGVLRTLIREGRDYSVAESRLQSIIMWVILILPILHWHSAASQFRLFYYTEGDLFRFLPSEPIATINRLLPWVFMIAIGFSAFHFFRQKRRSYLPIFVLQVGTFLWFYMSLVALDHTPLYWILTPIMHGLVYICFVVSSKARDYTPAPRAWLYHLRYLVPLLFVVATWDHLRPTMMALAEDRATSSFGQVFWGLFWAPGILHLTLDSLIWRSKVMYPTRA